MIKELNQARKHLNLIYAMDEQDKISLNEAKSIPAKVTSYIVHLEAENDKLRETIGRNIS